MLRRLLITAGAAVVLAAAAAPAQAIEIGIGPGGFYVGPSPYYYYGEPYYYEPAPYGYYADPGYSHDRYDRYPYETRPGFGGTLDYPDTGS